MVFFWTLFCLLTVTTVSLVQAKTSGASSKCDSATTYLDVADEMIGKVKTCPSDECDSSSVYLEVAGQMIKKAKDKCTKPPTCDVKHADCSDVLQAGHTRSGVYKVWPRSRFVPEGPIDVYCDMDTDGGGWTVIQRRGNYSRTNLRDFFYKDWASYKKGFGNIEEDFWLGNDAIHALSTQRRTSVRFDLEDVEGTRKHALYSLFWIEDESNKYMLHVGGYSGDANDSFTYHTGDRFSTKDQDNDRRTNASCAQKFKGGWWYYDCYQSNLNGIYEPGKYEGRLADRVTWKTFKGPWECLQTTEIKLRPIDFGRKHPSDSSTQPDKQDLKSSHFFLKAIEKDFYKKKDPFPSKENETSVDNETLVDNDSDVPT